MGLFNHFPYPDTHQLNLDWILDVVKNCIDKVTELWTYVREPGEGIQKALLDAKAAAITAENSAKNAQNSASYAQQYVTQVQNTALEAHNSATTAQQSASNAREDADLCRRYLNDIKYMWGRLYPVGAVYVNYRNQALDAESDATVIARLQALTGGTWARAGSRGQPVTETGKLGMATIILTNDGGDYQETNFNIYVRTA